MEPEVCAWSSLSDVVVSVLADLRVERGEAAEPATVPDPGVKR